jgi:SAM-dependent methyltransferase
MRGGPQGAAASSVLEVAAGDDASGLTPTEFTIVRCRSCGLAYTDPRPTSDEMAAFYPHDYWGRSAAQRPGSGGAGEAKPGDLERAARGAAGGARDRAVESRPLPLLERLEEAYRRRQQREVVLWLRRLRPRRGRLLDVGAGRGDLLAALRDDGWRVSGVEPSAAATATARRRFGLDVLTSTLESADLRDDAGEELLFDAVVFAGVVEHLPDPLASLRRARALLAPDGLLAVLFLPRLDSPQARLFGSRWLALDLPRHLYHFDDKSWSHLIGQAGFSIEAVEPYSARHSPPLWVTSAFPGLHKHRFYQAAEDGESVARRTAKQLAYVVLTTAVRPLCRLEARRGLEGQRSHFLRRA